MVGRGYYDLVQKKLPFWFKDEVDLLPFTTIKTDLKKNINKMP